MESESPSQLLSYEAPRDTAARERELLAKMPDSGIGIASCVVFALALVATLLAFLLAPFFGEGMYVMVVVGFGLCVCPGVPLAIGGILDPNRRPRAGIIALA